VDACNPLLQAHPTWARDEHEGRGIPTSLTPVSGRLAPSPLRARPRPIWAGARGDTHSSARGTPRSRNADRDKLEECDQRLRRECPTVVYIRPRGTPSFSSQLAPLHSGNTTCKHTTHTKPPQEVGYYASQSGPNL
jgi:hypothetical protein